MAALLGAGISAADLDVWLSALEQREVVSRQPESRFAGERELAFRHAMVREAAYAMLTDGDRALGHRLAGAWLERAGETGAAVIIEHNGKARRREQRGPSTPTPARGSRPSRATTSRGRWRAPKQASPAGRRAGGSDASAPVQALAAYWRGEIADMARHAMEAATLLPPTAERRWIAAAEATRAAQLLGRRDDLLARERGIAACLAGGENALQA